MPLGFRQTQTVRALLAFQQEKQAGRERDKERETGGEGERQGERDRERRRGTETQAGRGDPCAYAQREEEGKAG